MSRLSFTNFCREPLKHNNILLSSAKFVLDPIQNVTLDFSNILDKQFFKCSNILDKYTKKIVTKAEMLEIFKKIAYGRESFIFKMPECLAKYGRLDRSAGT